MIPWLYDSSALSYAETETKTDLITYGQTGKTDLFRVKLEIQTKSKNLHFSISPEELERLQKTTYDMHYDLYLSKDKIF